MISGIYYSKLNTKDAIAFHLNSYLKVLMYPVQLNDLDFIVQESNTVMKSYLIFANFQFAKTLG